MLMTSAPAYEEIEAAAMQVQAGLQEWHQRMLVESPEALAREVLLDFVHLDLHLFRFELRFGGFWLVDSLRINFAARDAARLLVGEVPFDGAERSEFMEAYDNSGEVRVSRDQFERWLRWLGGCAGDGTHACPLGEIRRLLKVLCHI